MIVYSSKDALKGGQPFGGFGAGKFEILPNGLFNSFTFANNWSRPIAGDNGFPGFLGYHLAFSLEDPSTGQRKAFLLQTAPIRHISCVKAIRYEAEFPKATLRYEEPLLPAEISLEIFSPWVAGDNKHSSLPTAFFDFKVRNRSRKPLKVGFLFIGRNVSGEWCVGRQNRISETPQNVSLEFLNNDPDSHDVRQGSLRFTFQKEGWQTSYIECWNAVTKNFSFDSSNISLQAFDHFSETGSLPNSRQGHIARGENQELCGAVAAHKILKSGEQKTLSFNASWFYPKHPLGHRYQNWFKSSADAADYAISKKDALTKKTEKFQKAMRSLPYPEWFRDALGANLSPFFASTWYVKDGRFSFYEAPFVCPLMGTVDVGFYGSIPLSYFFPELEQSLIWQFAHAQREDGYIPHDLGKNRLDFPSDGTTFYLWKDLNPKFILMAYRDYLWSGKPKVFLSRIYPHIKKSLKWSLGTDHDGNGLPDNEGADQTFDLWEFYGTNAYTSSIFLAAVLACEQMARINGDSAFQKECHKRFLHGKYSFEKELWNGKFFGPTHCMLSQLNGQWYADLLGLGNIVDKYKAHKALDSVFKLNAKSSFGLVNSVDERGRLDTSNNHARNVWCGMNYAFASLALMRGYSLNAVLKPVQQIWDNASKYQMSPWNQPDMIDSKTGEFVFGDFYYRNMAIWAIPIAHSLKNRRAASVLKSIRSIVRSK